MVVRSSDRHMAHGTLQAILAVLSDPRLALCVGVLGGTFLACVACDRPEWG